MRDSRRATQWAPFIAKALVPLALIGWVAYGLWPTTSRDVERDRRELATYRSSGVLVRQDCEITYTAYVRGDAWRMLAPDIQERIARTIAAGCRKPDGTSHVMIIDDDSPNVLAVVSGTSYERLPEGRTSESPPP